MSGGGRMGRSWKVMMSWYRWNFHTWLEIDLTSKKVLLQVREQRLVSVDHNGGGSLLDKRAAPQTWCSRALTYLNTAMSKLTRRMFATRR